MSLFADARRMGFCRTHGLIYSQNLECARLSAKRYAHRCGCYGDENLVRRGDAGGFEKLCTRQIDYPQLLGESIRENPEFNLFAKTNRILIPGFIAMFMSLLCMCIKKAPCIGKGQHPCIFNEKYFRNINRNISVIEQAQGLGEQRVPQMEWIFGGVYG